MFFSIAMGAEYLPYVKSIAIFAPTFYGYIISVLASVDSVRTSKCVDFGLPNSWEFREVDIPRFLYRFRDS